MMMIKHKYSLKLHNKCGGDVGVFVFLVGGGEVVVGGELSDVKCIDWRKC